MCRKSLIDTLFAGGNRSMTVFPIRAVYMETAQLEAPAQILVSVSKRRFTHAVDRNRVKRQLRTAYRTRKHILWEALQQHGAQLAVAFLWIDNKHYPTQQVEQKMETLLHRIAESL